jgi:integrase
MVETLVYYRKNGTHVPDKAVANWLTAAPAELQAKLAKVGLINVTKSKTCQETWDACLQSKTDVKPVTSQTYLNHRSIFFETFPLDEPVERITPERLLKWKQALLDEYSQASVAGFVKVTRMVFGYAVKRKWLHENPLEGIPVGSFINRDNDRIISMEEYAKLLNACLNQEWRTIIALARIGGLRCPSELKQLRWSDVHWAENRFLVHSPKTERYVEHRERLVPLFPELRAVLERHFAETPCNEFVIQHYQGMAWQIGSPFQTIARRAGLGTIIRPFDNMRMSRSNEVEQRWGAKLESLWIGHSEATMRKHYAKAREEDFADAAKPSLESQVPHADDHAEATDSDGLG